MKAEFVLSLDSHGRPCINFRHYDKSDSLEQIILREFIDGAVKNGLHLNNVSGFIDSNGNSWENYGIYIKSDSHDSL